MLIKSISDFRKAMRLGPYAWPGGYPVFFVTSDGGALCFNTAREQRRQILEAIKHNDDWSGWRVEAIDINWEDSELVCDHSGERIESAYGN